MRDAMIQPATPRQIAAFAAQKGIDEAKARDTLAALRHRLRQRRQGWRNRTRKRDGEDA